MANQPLLGVEIGNEEAPAVVHPAAPYVLEQARLGNIALFQGEFTRHNYPLDFTAGRDVYSNRTALHLAAMQGHDAIVELILNHPDISRDVVNATDCFGYTPLHLAVRHSHENVVRLLTTSALVLPDRFLSSTSEPDDRGGNHGGYTPLHFAAENENIPIARLLLQQPCQERFSHDPVNIHAITWRGDTAMDIAHRKRSSEFLEFLRTVDANWVLQERERNATAANAVLVGATLVVAAAFGSWLQLPGGILAPPASSPSPSNADDSRWNSFFFMGTTIAFACSVVALVIGTCASHSCPAVSLKVEVRKQQQAVRFAQCCLVAAIVALVGCFSSATSSVLHELATTFGAVIHQITSALPFTILGVLGLCFGWIHYR